MSLRNKTTAEKIGYFRQRNGLTQLELSIRTGITRDQISRLERGLCKPHLETIMRLEKALGLPQWTLMENDYGYQEPSDDIFQDQIIQNISEELAMRDLSKKDLRIVQAAALAVADSLIGINSRFPE